MRQVIEIEGKTLSDRKISIKAVMVTPAGWTRDEARHEKDEFMDKLHRALRFSGFTLTEITIKK